MIRAEPISEAEAKKSRRAQDIAVGRSDLLRMDPRTLRIEEGFNARLSNFDPSREEDLKLARSIAANGVRIPLIAWMKDGEPTITDGHRRLGATLYAMDVLGAGIRTVPVCLEPKHASETDRAYTVLISDERSLLEPIERANHYAKLIGYGETEAEIAAKIGRTRQHVSDLLKFRAAPKVVVDMVKDDKVSATLAIQTLKEHQGDAATTTAVLYAGLAKAKSEGKTKVTAKHLDRPAPDLTKSVGYRAGLKRAVEILFAANMIEAGRRIEAEIGDG